MNNVKKCDAAGRVANEWGVVPVGVDVGNEIETGIDANRALA